MPTKKGSWRDKKKGDCFTVKGGAVVCAGSAGMNYKAKKPRGKQTGITKKKEAEKEARKKAAPKKKVDRAEKRKDYKKPTPKSAPSSEDMKEDIRLYRWRKSGKEGRTYGSYSQSAGTVLKKTETDMKLIKKTEKWDLLSRSASALNAGKDRREIYKNWVNKTPEGKTFRKDYVAKGGKSAGKDKS